MTNTGKALPVPHASIEAIAWPRTGLLELLGLVHPIIQAPMGRYSGPALVAAVSNAGALGSLGCGLLSVDSARRGIAEVKRSSEQPFNVNFYIPPVAQIDSETADLVRGRLSFYYGLLGLGAVPKPSHCVPCFDEERLELVLETRPRAVSFHFGMPPSAMIAQIKQAGCAVLCSATTVTEAKALEDQGADAIIAQGVEAGGPRGTFTRGDGAGLIGTIALVPQVVDAVRVPVIAAGGIADGRAIAAAFALGASGVQIGTAFLGCHEAMLSEPHREALRQASDEDTRLTRVFTGHPTRVLRNRLTDEMGDAEAVAFPAQLSLTRPMTKACQDSARTDLAPLFAGQAVPLVRNLPAATLVKTLVEETRTRLPRSPLH